MVQASSSTGGLSAGALYAAASPGVVDITAEGSSSGGKATGTGFVVDSAGHIVTASHVVDGASKVTVKFAGGATRTATVTGKDDATDVAVLKIDPSGLTLHPLKLASSSSLAVGSAVAAIGDPFGYARSISTGIVSGVDRTIQAPNGFTVAHAIQTDAALNPGNSGGPLLNASGEVVGIVDQIATDGNADQSSGVGFAVPIDLVKSQLSRSRPASRSATPTSASPPRTRRPAARRSGRSTGRARRQGRAAGRRRRHEARRHQVNSSSDLVAAIADHAPGDQVKVTVRRGSRTLERTVTLGTQPAQTAAAG